MKYHSLGELKQLTFYFSQFRDWDVQDQGAGQFGYWQELPANLQTVAWLHLHLAEEEPSLSLFFFL